MKSSRQGFTLNEKNGYFCCGGVNIMAFDDFYPAGHQSGVSIIMHGKRIATGGDVRLEQTPAQWQPVPKQKDRSVSEKDNCIVTTLGYPDREGHLKGFNPIIYPDLELDYKVSVKSAGEEILVTVELEQPVPEEFAGKVCFNLELFPGELFGKSWIMDERYGIFPRQPNGPTQSQPSNVLHKSILPPEKEAMVTPAQLAGQGVEIGGQRSGERFAFTRFHFGDTALMQHDAAHQLHAEGAQAQHALGAFAHDGEGFYQQLVKMLAALGELLQFARFFAQAVVRQLFVFSLQRVDGVSLLEQRL